VVMVWRAIGCSEPTRTLPISTVDVGRRRVLLIDSQYLGVGMTWTEDRTTERSTIGRGEDSE